MNSMLSQGIEQLSELGDRKIPPPKGLMESLYDKMNPELYPQAIYAFSGKSNKNTFLPHLKSFLHKMSFCSKFCELQLQFLNFYLQRLEAALKFD